MTRTSRFWTLADRAITPEDAYRTRREVLATLAAAGLLPACAAGVEVAPAARTPVARGPQDKPKPQGATSRPDTAVVDAPATLFRAPPQTYPAGRNPGYRVPERELTPEDAATSYNNFYEFSLNKQAVARLVGKFKTAPWSVEIAGLVDRPGVYDLETWFAKLPSEERVYRFRCVEAWAMTVPWTGFPMKQLLGWVKPKPEAKFVRMVTFDRPAEAPNQRPGSGYDWPYYEALTIEEAGHDLTLLAHGLYGKELPRQNGAPLRLVVPWKYGLKSIKSIVRIEFTAKRPPAFWNDLAAAEYSWHSNVEPHVPHPRWSQAHERLIPDGKRVATLPYNGYADLVAHLYAS